LSKEADMTRQRRHPLFGIALAATLLAGASGAARADADGPDYYRVRDLHPGAALTIHTGPGADTKVIGWVPYNGARLKNLGCKGGMNIVEWEKATPAERLAGRFRRWCRITYKGTTGWVNGGYLGE
jgi:hypothetical protein